MIRVKSCDRLWMKVETNFQLENKKTSRSFSAISLLEQKKESNTASISPKIKSLIHKWTKKKKWKWLWKEQKMIKLITMAMMVVQSSNFCTHCVLILIRKEFNLLIQIISSKNLGAELINPYIKNIKEGKGARKKLP